MAQRVLGLDIGRSSVKGVVLETNMRNFELVGFHSEPITAEPTAEEEMRRAALQSALFHLMEQLGPVDQIYTTLPGDVGATSVLEMPFSDAGKIEQTLPFQIDDLTPFDVQDLIYDYQFIERSKGPSKLLVGTAPRSLVKEYLEELQEVSIDPRVMMVDGLPYYHLFGNVSQQPHSLMWAVLDMGYNQTTLTIFRARPDDPQHPFRVEMVRSLARGVRHIQQGAAQVLGVTVEQLDEWMLTSLNLDPNAPSPNQQLTEAFTKALSPTLVELRRTITAAQRSLHLPIEHLLLTGGGALLNGIEGFFSQRLGMETELLRIDTLPSSEGVEWPAAHATYCKAVGLALKSLTNRDPYARLNLRQQEFSFRGDLQFLKERMGSLMLMGTILILLFCTSVFTSFYARSVEGQRLEQEIEKRCYQIIGRRGLTPRRCLGIMNDEIQKVSGKGGTALVPRVSSYDLLLVFYQRIADLNKDRKIKVEINSLRITPKRFDFEGETNSYASVDKIEQRLKTYKCLSNIKKGKVQRSAGKDDKVEFRLTAILSC